MAAQKRGRLMNMEIHEQPDAVARLLDNEFERIWKMAEHWHDTPPRGILIAARGTSDHAALYAKYVFETVTGIPTGLFAPSVATIYETPLNVKDFLVIGISQSGEAADVVGVMEMANRNGAETLAITNVDGSPLTVAAQQTILLHALPEKAVAATKTFTTTMAAVLMLAAAISRDEKVRTGLQRIPGLIYNVFQTEDAIRAEISQFRYLQDCVILGRGYNMATAYELALKLRETCYIRSQPFASPDFVHGPIAILDEGLPVLAFANQGAPLPSVLDVIEKSRSRGGDLIVIGNAHEALVNANVAFPVNMGMDVPEILSPFPSIVVGQIIAQGLAVFKGYDPDRPRGLKKVTITR